MKYGVPNQIPSAVVLDQKTLSLVFLILFSTGTYAGIGTKCAESENIMKSTKKNIFNILPWQRAERYHCNVFEFFPAPLHVAREGLRKNQSSRMARRFVSEHFRSSIFSTSAPVRSGF